MNRPGRPGRTRAGVLASACLSGARFPLPPAPAGRVPRSARLTFRTSSESAAGPADSHNSVPVTGAWTESAVTYSTRPTLSTSVPGTITGASAVSTDHSADLGATALDGALGSVTSLAPTSSGTDSLRIRSSEATAACGPQLVLTFGDE
ncbi:DNRLRE domain-containing protein [[Kitasatospora] papulosa]|uniref:DNRLRE domain-containing protein n=1 Tax=Streptomyces TaxID=1883 RepID=UPI00341ABDFE